MKAQRSTWLTSGIFMIALMSGCASQPPATAVSKSTTVAETSPPAEHADLSGTWEYVMTNDQQEPVSGLLTIQRGGYAGYTGSITLNGMQSDNEMNIRKAQLNGPNFIYEGEVITPEGNIPFTMKGIIQGSKLEGQNTVLYKNRSVIWKVKATRK